MNSKNTSSEKIALRKKYPVTYGRRKSRSLNENQQQLMKDFHPQVGLFLEGDSIKKYIRDTKNKKQFLEIGFGDGEHLLHIAKNDEDASLIGCEVFKNSFVVCLQKLYKEKRQNVRLFLDDSRYLLEKFPEEFLDKVFILFPDPWPKQKQFKRRIVNQQTLDIIYPLMKTKATVRLATDIDSYFTQMLAVFEKDNRFKLVTKEKDFPVAPKDHITTKYHQKAIDEGRVPRFVEYMKL